MVKARLPLFFVWMMMAVLALSACAGAPAEPTPTETATRTNTATWTATMTASPAPTDTPTPSQTPTATLTPTPDGVYGVVAPEQLSCRFGPGGAYLLRTTLYAGERIEVLGYMDLNTNWLLVHTLARPDFNCWVSGNFVELDEGHLPIGYIVDPHLVMPWSTIYGPLKGVSASREGNIVTVRWSKMTLNAGDDSLQTPYLVEAWVCQGGVYLFRAFGSGGSSVEIQDEDGCEQPSRGRVMGAEKHGYTRWVEVPWP